MKNGIILFVLALMPFLASAQSSNEKFVKAMEKTLSGMDTLTTPAQWQDRANGFERIAQKEKGEWLPNYYVALCQIMVFNMEKDQTKWGAICDKTDRFVALADSLQPQNSEVYVLKNMAASLRIRINPMANGQKYGMLASVCLAKAKELDPENPRVYMQEGLALLFTPPQWGGDKEKAKETLDVSAQKYETFKPASSIHPNWGKEILPTFIEMAKK